MAKLSPRKLFTVFAALSLVFTLAVAACPTCDADGHLRAVMPAGAGPDSCSDQTFVTVWQDSGEGCDCCESDGCLDDQQLPEGLLKRTAPDATSAVLGGVSTVPWPGAGEGGQVKSRVADPPRSDKLHILHASFRC